MMRKLYFDNAKSWVKSWFDTLEMLNEFEDSYKKLLNWCYINFLFLQTFNQKSTKFLKAGNSIMKSTAGGPCHVKHLML
jgi:hypothetical protein